MNEQIKNKIKNSKKTIYQISKETGINYTTISELYNEKTNINKCASYTVFRLALYFKCEIKDILNKETLISNIEGIYKKIKYKWEVNSDNTVSLWIIDNGEKKIIDTGYYNQSRFYNEYFNMTKVIIDAYLEKKKGDELING